MDAAWFIAREGLTPGNVMTAHGPFPSEEAAIEAAKTFHPGKFTIYGGAKPGKTFSIAQPSVVFDT